MTIRNNFRSDFITWYYNEFTQDPLFKTMEGTTEGSSWHREKSVAIHTNMVVSEYISWANKEWDKETLIGAMAAAFHDTGKPSARVEKYSEKRGKYNSFGGHEIISARLWEDYAVRNAERIWELFEERDIKILWYVGFVIEHHMPYEQADDKVQNIATTAALLFESLPIFQNHLTADTHGRIADDHKDKIQAVDAWIENFEMKMHVPVHLESGIRSEKTLILPIGPSGCGKSTLFKKLSKEHTLHQYSWDLLRLEWYDSDYSKAYKMSVDDPSFNAKYMKEFKTQILSNKTIYIDNTNLSRKRRRPFIDDARKHGYNVIGYVFPIALETLLRRQKTRGDKDVPADAVKQHYMSLQCPLYGEFDHIEVINTLA